MDRRQLYNDAEETMKLVLDGRQVNTWTAIPAIVTAVNLGNMTIEAQPAIQATVEDENGNPSLVSLPVLINVPIVYPSAGGFTITFPIAVGDEVLIIFSCRAIDSWWQSGGVQKSVESRMHDLSDGFAILGPKSQPRKISGISSTKLQIRKDDDSVHFEMDGSGVTIKGDLHVTGEITGHSTGTPVNLTTHHHTGVTTGVGNSGGPVG